jgi:hypothetical protein
MTLFVRYFSYLSLCDSCYPNCNLNIARLFSFVRKFMTCLITTLSGCQSNILNLILFIDKSFAHMLART